MMCGYNKRPKIQFTEIARTLGCLHPTQGGVDCLRPTPGGVDCHGKVAMIVERPDNAVDIM